MAISYPLDFLAAFPGHSTMFDILNIGEWSRDGNSKIYVKEMADPIWQATFETKELRPNTFDEWQARISLLENGMQKFKAFSRTRCFPIAYPNGSWPTGLSFNGYSSQVSSVGGNNKSLAVKGLPPTFKLSVGDHICINEKYLHRVVEAATAGDPSGVTGTFEVRPHFRTGAGIAIDQSVRVIRPFCIMNVVPGTVTANADKSTARGVISFQAAEDLS